jgi:hypothetical protein
MPELYLGTTYFKADCKILQQKNSMNVKSFEFFIVSSIFPENLEKLALYSAQYRPSRWLQNADRTFMVWSHGTDKINIS